MTTGASRRAFACRDHNGIAEVVAARVRSLPIKAGAIGSAQRKQYKLSARSRAPRDAEMSGGDSYGHHFRQYVLDDMAPSSSPASGCPAGSVDAPGGAPPAPPPSSHRTRRLPY